MKYMDYLLGTDRGIDLTISCSSHGVTEKEM